MHSDDVFLPRAVHLYDGARTDALRIDEIARFVRSILPNTTLLVQGDVIHEALSRLSGDDRDKTVAALARSFALARVQSLTAQEETDYVSYAELEYEKRRLVDSTIKASGVLYDGQKLVSTYAGLLPPEELNTEHAHVAFTNQLFGTWDENDLRYHARVSVYGYPCLISTSGIVEAPARPREFHLKRQLGTDPLLLREEFRGRFIDYDDPHMTEVVKGYVAQALFYHMTGEPFCENKDCRLYNAHWQEELIRAQLTGDDFCSEHAAFLAQLADVDNIL